MENLLNRNNSGVLLLFLSDIIIIIVSSLYIMHMEQMYTPQPMDTSDVHLPEELQDLVEKMAKNVHEVWAQSRISQGWTYGPERSDALKQHPCLVPYEELSEIEKAYARNTAVGTLKLICKLGYKIL